MSGRGAKRAKRSSGVANAFAYALVLLPVVLAYVYVYLFGVNIPFGDVWTMVPRFDQWSLGTLSFGDLWVQHFEHRMFFTRSALLALGLVTEFNNFGGMYLTLTFFLFTLIVLLAAFRDSIGSRLLLFVPVSVLVFNLEQYFNMFHAFQASFAMAQAFGVLAFYLIYVSTRGSFKPWAFIASLASGVVATFSFSAGLFLWPAGLLQLVISPVERRTKAILSGVWVLSGAVVWAAYFYGLRIPERQQEHYFFNSPTLGADYLLVLLGSPLFNQLFLALLSGLLLVGLISGTLLSVYRAGKLGECSFWIALLAFSLLLVAAIWAGRSAGGLETALASRYITFAGLTAVSVYAMLAKLALERGSRVITASFGVLLALIVVGTPFSYADGLKKGRQLEALKEREAAILSTYSVQPDRVLDIANRQPETVREGAFVLCRLGYSVFSDPRVQARNCLPPPFNDISQVGSSAPSSVETIAGKVVVEGGRPVAVPEERSSVRVTGWAVDSENRGPAGGVYVEVDGKRFPAFYGRSRTMGTPKSKRDELRIPPLYEFTGFEVEIPTSEIGTGEHQLSVVVVTNDREGYYPAEQKAVFEVG